MANRFEAFALGWQQLGSQEKKQCLYMVTKSHEDIHKPVKEFQQKHVKELHKVVSVPEPKFDVYENVSLYSYYSYLFYYPTIHWSLDKTPDTDDYWVGIYKVGELDDTKYLSYQYIKKVAQGSYYVGELSTTPGEEGKFRYEEFEMRIFNGEYRRVDADTNILRGRVQVGPTNLKDEAIIDKIEHLPPSKSEIIPFLSAFQEGIQTSKQVNFSLEDLHGMWREFDLQEQQLILPTLEQKSLPDDIRNPSPRLDERPEPKLLYSNLGQIQKVLTASDPANTPEQISLSITLDYSYTYVYPVVNTEKGLQSEDAYLGVYSPTNNAVYDANGYIDNDWWWVGKGYEGNKYLNRIDRNEQGNITAHYPGVIFDNSTKGQLGFASTSILATISVTPRPPPPPFDPQFDVPQALTYAYLSQLAYEPYDTVVEQLPRYDLKPVMEIYNLETDTHGFIAHNDTKVVVAFRGTASVKNIMSDVWFFRTPVAPNRSELCHSGFVKAFNSVYEPINNALQPFIKEKKKIFITGHSLGAALASLLTFRLSLSHKRENLPEMFVFGCPPVGDSTFANYFNGMDSFVITIEGDPVSTGKLVMIGPWVGLYKPALVYYLPKTAGHSIQYYINQLKKIQF